MACVASVACVASWLLWLLWPLVASWISACVASWLLWLLWLLRLFVTSWSLRALVAAWLLWLVWLMFFRGFLVFYGFRGFYGFCGFCSLCGLCGFLASWLLYPCGSKTIASLIPSPSVSHTTYSHRTYGTWRHRTSLCVAGVALLALGWLWWRAWFSLEPRLFMWQVWHLEASWKNWRKTWKHWRQPWKNWRNP